MKYELIIFDLDGTLLDTIKDLTDAVNHAMRFFKMPERSEQEVLSFVGNGNRVLIEKCVPRGTDPDTVMLALEKFHEYYSRHYADKTTAYDGIYPLLDKLKEMGLHLAVVSNKADYAVQDICQKYFNGIFDFVIGDREGIRRKPAADPVDLARETLHFSKEQTLYVGDSDVDIVTAANAGVRCISVDWGFRPHELLAAAGAHEIISSPEELLQLLFENNLDPDNTAG